MTNARELATNFLQKAQDSLASKPPLQRGAINAFQALFSVQELEEREALLIDRLVFDGTGESPLEEEAAQRDLLELKRLTKELKAIKKQELLLIGERVSRARDIFKSYKKRSFREWLELAFGSYKTGYNYLAFFDLYTAIPEELKTRLKELPAKAVYVLASKNAPIEVKSQIVRDCTQETSKGLVDFIRESLEEKTATRRPSKPKNERGLRIIEREACMIVPEWLDEFQKKRISDLISHLKEIIS